MLALLSQFETSYGGKDYAYDMEWKVRFFVQLVLMHVFRDQGDVRIDGENQIKQFDKKIAADL